MRLVCLPAFSLAMLALGECQYPAEPLTDQTRLAIIEALLASRPDTQADMEAWFEEEPEARHWTYELYDHRECVSRNLVGRVADFDSYRGLNYGKIREAATERFRLPDEIMPKQLRWDHPMSACVSGVLHISLPEIDGNMAKVHVANICDGWCGWGGVFTLNRVDGEWIVDSDFEMHWIA